MGSKINIKTKKNLEGQGKIKANIAESNQIIEVFRDRNDSHLPFNFVNPVFPPSFLVMYFASKNSKKAISDKLME